MTAPRDLEQFFASGEPVACLRITRVRGSSPRAEGTEMYVCSECLFGTIGGGQLEHLAIDAARELLASGDLSKHLDIPLGPQIGQCCGGRVEVSVTRMSAADKDAALSRDAEARAANPSVYILGAGHVGRALAAQLQHLPVHTVLIDQRAEELALSDAAVEKRLSAIPEIDVMSAPAGSAFIVLTHDHGLDFLLASAALQRADAAYVGLIGSNTKRIKFRNWCRKFCDGLSIAPLICPIGAGGSRDKRPAVIAAHVVAEVITALTSEPAAERPEGVTVSHIAAQ
ncbi:MULTISPECIES: xanthine dehydrogenase accessory protein XdhC [Halocynthiibacter]|uniref:Xanthine dehydrogenase accessory protein XdhC n=1 Tax=Halocynthiibacter halioticoli TaxID=2986804 RepID=A0AAE3LRK0_9RHOB|nr:MULTISPECIES: xanthine dehydrogenase accessory protein XdhC [Halocynthiibacter]MCV6824534.1 xanthine dehydrogenase accessory protein XdhC [Halocynthiibacter halioticoli]MCW4057535.1 xanthine dehydrogenase accessory protein XdhC [Halocynthiibacter sp. SDUM655004]